MTLIQTLQTVWSSPSLFAANSADLLISRDFLTMIFRQFAMQMFLMVVAAYSSTNLLLKRLCVIFFYLVGVRGNANRRSKDINAEPGLRFQESMMLW